MAHAAHGAVLCVPSGHEPSRLCTSCAPLPAANALDGPCLAFTHAPARPPPRQTCTHTTHTRSRTHAPAHPRSPAASRAPCSAASRRPRYCSPPTRAARWGQQLRATPGAPAGAPRAGARPRRHGGGAPRLVGGRARGRRCQTWRRRGAGWGPALVFGQEWVTLWGWRGGWRTRTVHHAPRVSGRGRRG